MFFDLICQRLQERKIADEGICVKDDVILGWCGLCEMRLQELRKVGVQVLLKTLSTSIANNWFICEKVASLLAILIEFSNERSPAARGFEVWWLSLMSAFH
jgi:hypothetical protein